MKCITAVLAMLTSVLMVLHPASGAAVPRSSEIEASRTAASNSRSSGAGAAKLNSEPSSSIKSTGITAAKPKTSGAAGAAGGSGKADGVGSASADGEILTNEVGTGSSASVNTTESSDKKIKGDRLPDCQVNWFADEKNMGKRWSESGAEQFADAWISKRKDHSNWAQRLLMELFPDVDHSEFSCVSTGAKCNFNRECKHFNEIGKGGLYYLFVSLRNFHNFMAATRETYFEKTFVASLEVGNMATTLKINKLSDAEGFDVFGMLSSAMGIAGAVSGPVGAGALGVMGGIMDMLGDATKK